MKAKKHLGQHFLNNPKIQERIVAALDLKGDESVIEIGPGRGAITLLLAQQAKEVKAIEFDQDVIEVLKEKLGLEQSALRRHSEEQSDEESTRSDAAPSVEIIHTDFLKWPWPAGEYVVVGNIPYNISTPIIENLIEHRRQIKRCVLLVQEEFGRRLAAAPGNKDYGSLSIFAQYHANIKYLFPVKAGSFSPPPKVESCVISLDFHDTGYKCSNEPFLFKMVQTIFTQRRKTLLNGCTLLVPKAQAEKVLNTLNIDPKIRAEQLTIKDFIRLAEALK